MAASADTEATLTVEQSAERGFPAGTEGGNAQRTQQLLAWMTGEVEERVDLGDRHLLGPGGDLEDLVSCLDVAFFENAKIEGGAVV